VEWLKVRNDVENIELMNLAGFCRNCLSKWLHAGMGETGSISDAKSYIYGMDYEDWKKLYRKGEKREHAPRIPEGNPPPVTQINPCASSLMKSSVPRLTGRACILTVSDRAAAGVYRDESGPAISALLQKEGIEVSQSRIVQDVISEIRNAVMEWVSEPANAPDLIITTGGTGFTQRDATPEALETIIEKKASGLSHLLLSSFVKQDPLFALTRLTAGTVGKTLIVSLPGRPSAVRDGVHVLIPILPKILLDLAR
jgi:molybdenum cofactor synthesis domain-containing protein